MFSSSVLEVDLEILLVKSKIQEKWCAGICVQEAQWYKGNPAWAGALWNEQPMEIPPSLTIGALLVMRADEALLLKITVPLCSVNFIPK